MVSLIAKPHTTSRQAHLLTPLLPNLHPFSTHAHIHTRPPRRHLVPGLHRHRDVDRSTPLARPGQPLERHVCHRALCGGAAAAGGHQPDGGRLFGSVLAGVCVCVCVCLGGGRVCTLACVWGVLGAWKVEE